jgi:alkanesulfonate monooxygenase SsuD/methylene tetrahydromethanopterin reductase-like flavin-dependent oxidoreductase (luciferase family)
MKVGLMVPQGFKHEYDGWDAATAWARSIELTKNAEALGFESLWVFDHVHTAPESTDDITLESFAVLSAMAMVTSRVRLGHMVICAGFRNAALTAKLASTLDVISNGRFELGIGAGWMESEWVAYGYGFPTVSERMMQLGDHLEVITRLLGPGRGTYSGRYASIDGAINVPKGIQSHIPVIVGGNGREKTANLAATFADELNLFDLAPDEVLLRVEEARAKCQVLGRDPDSLRYSLYSIQEELRLPGQQRVDYLASFADVGLSRLVCFPLWDVTLEGQARFAEDCVSAGLVLGQA